MRLYLHGHAVRDDGLVLLVGRVDGRPDGLSSDWFELRPLVDAARKRRDHADAARGAAYWEDLARKLAGDLTRLEQEHADLRAAAQALEARLRLPGFGGKGGG